MTLRPPMLLLCTLVLAGCKFRFTGNSDPDWGPTWGLRLLYPESSLDRTVTAEHPDYVPGTPAIGAQTFRFHTRHERTFVLADVRVAGHNIEQWPVAQFAGVPGRRFSPETQSLPLPAIVEFAIRTRNGTASRGTILLENEQHRYPKWHRVGADVSITALPPGTWTIRRQDAFLWFDGKPGALHFPAGKRTRVLLRACEPARKTPER